MPWDQLSINKPHLVYLILGGFTSLFMLCSSIIKEKFYIGEATVATLCGIIFGPHAAGLIDPNSWGNVDQITLEFSRIVLVVQCFAIGVELPKAYMERHWKSVAYFLIPVMTFGYLVTSLFIWALIPSLNWLDSLVIAACVTATDPVLASSVVGKGKFAKRVPKHIRDILSAESGCNDGMAFPFIYLGLNIIHYRNDPGKIVFHWVCYTILYECLFGAVYGFIVGYCARRAIRFAHEKNFIDRESFLVFYFVLALFCAGSGSLLGMDDLLVGFACGVGFSNDGWFTAETEESHVSNVIDLLINLAFFVYFGAIIPWEQFNADLILGLTAWRLAVLGILVLLFRRIPIVVALKPLIPDVKTWREAFFCGHFGPIGVGAIFVAILARAELETDSTTPLAELPQEGFPHRNVIELIWPVTCFLVICSIIVHGSSIAVFSLGRHINTLTLTMSYTQGNDSSWMERLPRIQSRSRTSMSQNRGNDLESSLGEKEDLTPGVVPKNFLRRQKEDENNSRASSRKPLRRKKDSRYGGPISQSAIAPVRQNSEHGDRPSNNRSDSDTLAMRSEDSPDAIGNENSKTGRSTPSDEAARDGEQVYEEGDKTVYEDRDGEVVEVEQESPGLSGRQRQEHERDEANHLAKEESQHGLDATRHEVGEKTNAQHKEEAAEGDDEGPSAKGWRKNFTMSNLAKSYQTRAKASAEKKPEEKRGPARAYQYGNTIIVEDEDGEVIKKYDIGPPGGKNRQGSVVSGLVNPEKSKARMYRMGSYLGVKPRDNSAATDAQKASGEKAGKNEGSDDDGDDGLRFTMTEGGRRLSKLEFIEQIQRMDPKSRARAVEQADVPETVKEEARADAAEDQKLRKGKLAVPDRGGRKSGPSSAASEASDRAETSGSEAEIRHAKPHEQSAQDGNGLTLTTSDNEDVPMHDVTRDVARHHSQQLGGGIESAAQRRRREASTRAAQQTDEDSEDDGTPRVPPNRRRDSASRPSRPAGASRHDSNTEEETAAERRRREGALGIRSSRDGSDSDSDAGDKGGGGTAQAGSSSGIGNNSRIRFAESTVEAGSSSNSSSSNVNETPADRRRREMASGPLSSHREEDGNIDPKSPASGGDDEEISSPASTRSSGVRFADTAPLRQGETAAARRRRLAGSRFGGRS